MKAIDFPEKNQDIGKGQEQYETLPAKIIVSQQVPIWSCWKPTEEDLKKLNNGDSIWVCQLSFGAPFQPTLLTMDRPDFKTLDAEADKAADQLIQDLNEKYKKGDIDLTPEDAKKLREKMQGKHLKAEKGGKGGSK